MLRRIAPIQGIEGLSDAEERFGAMRGVFVWAGWGGAVRVGGEWLCCCRREVTVDGPGLRERWCGELAEPAATRARADGWGAMRLFWRMLVLRIAA